MASVLIESDSEQAHKAQESSQSPHWKCKILPNWKSDQSYFYAGKINAQTISQGLELNKVKNLLFVSYLPPLLGTLCSRTLWTLGSLGDQIPFVL